MKKYELLIIVPGYGDTGNNIGHKKQILDKNLDYFLRSQKGKVIIKQFNRPDFLYYNDKYEIFLLHKDLSLSKFLYEYITPELVKDYDYTILILDDVEIRNIDLSIEHVIEVYEKSGADILSPSVENATWAYLEQRKDSKPKEIRLVNGGIEFFCYLMRPQSYETYYRRVLVPWNDYMWGYDLILDYTGLKSGIYDFWKAKHYYKSSEKSAKEKTQQMMQYLQYFFKGGHVPDVIGRMGTLREMITV